MTELVMVGLDGRAHDADALALAGWLQAALPGRILLVHVCPPAPPGRGMAESEALEQGEGRELLIRAAEAVGGAPESELIEPMSPADGLSRLARERRAEILVLGSSHRGAVGQIVPGSVASQLLSHAPCAIAVAPVGFAKHAAGPVTRIGVAYDTTQAADLALHAAADASRRLGVPLHLYHAFYPAPKGPGWDAFRGHMGEFARSILDCGLQKLPPDVEATAHVLEGHVAEALSEATERDHVDLLYVGSRGYGPLREAVVGGVAGGLLHTSRVPLVIVPLSMADARAGPDD